MTILNRFLCHLGRKCPAQDNDYDRDLRRIEEADAAIRLAIRDTAIALRYERDMATKRRRENDTPQRKGQD